MAIPLSCADAPSLFFMLTQPVSTPSRSISKHSKHSSPFPEWQCELLVSVACSSEEGREEAPAPVEEPKPTYEPASEYAAEPPAPTPEPSFSGAETIESYQPEPVPALSRNRLSTLFR